MPELQQQSGCPQCGYSTTVLHAIDQGMRLRLEKEGHPTSFDSVCTNCFKNFSKNLSSASLLQAEQIIQDNFKKNLWTHRLSLIRQARIQLERHQHSEAAISYEKYLKIIQYVFDKKREDINATLFKDQPREVTLICGALWALVEIYDLHASYQSKQTQSAKKLGELLPYTNLFANIVKQATIKIRHAKNPQAYRDLLHAANVKTGNCFIASIAFENRNDPTLVLLRQFRNQVLIKSTTGRFFVNQYYRWSPGLANRLQHFRAIKRFLRLILPPFAKALKVLFKLKEM